MGAVGRLDFGRQLIEHVSVIEISVQESVLIQFPYNLLVMLSEGILFEENREPDA